ncbi:MAG: type II toxin-antitoxin system VapC family toxin [Thiohalocapsa sp.]
MVAVDTNVIVRYLTGDDPQEFTRAKAVIDAGDVFLPTTVLLEAECVLRSLYRYPRSRIAEGLRSLAGLVEINLEEPSLTAKALDWFEGGLDFAAALHLARSAHCEAMITFDRAFIRGGERLGGIPVRAP